MTHDSWVSSIAFKFLLLVVLLFALLILAGVASLFAARPEESASSRPTKAVISRPQSPGSKIVFGSVRNSGNHDIFVMDQDGNNQVRLTTSPV